MIYHVLVYSIFIMYTNSTKLMDQSGAFDLCDHKLLIEKLKLLGVEGNSACWLESYLMNRTQITLVDGYLSASIPLPPCSVIQGGIGSGLLYLVYTNDLPDTIHNHTVDFENPVVHCKEDGSMVNFVDDGTVYYADKNPEVVSQKLSDHYSAVLLTNTQTLTNWLSIQTRRI